MSSSMRFFRIMRFSSLFAITLAILFNPSMSSRIGAYTELLAKHAMPVIIDNVLIVISFLPPSRLVF